MKVLRERLLWSQIEELRLSSEWVTNPRVKVGVMDVVHTRAFNPVRFSMEYLIDNIEAQLKVRL